MNRLNMPHLPPDHAKNVIHIGGIRQAPCQWDSGLIAIYIDAVTPVAYAPTQDAADLVTEALMRWAEKVAG